MTEKENQNPDFWSQESLKSQEEPSQEDQRAELQKELKNQLQSLQEELKNNSSVEQNNQKILDQLSNLDERIQSLDALRGELFALQSEKIQDELDALRSSWNDFFSLKRDIKKSNPSYFAQVKKQLPEHNPKANTGRWESIEKITSITPRDWENLVANFAAWIIQKILA